MINTHIDPRRSVSFLLTAALLLAMVGGGCSSGKVMSRLGLDRREPRAEAKRNTSAALAAGHADADELVGELQKSLAEIQDLRRTIESNRREEEHALARMRDDLHRIQERYHARLRDPDPRSRTAEAPAPRRSSPLSVARSGSEAPERRGGGPPPVAFASRVPQSRPEVPARNEVRPPAPPAKDGERVEQAASADGIPAPPTARRRAQSPDAAKPVQTGISGPPMLSRNTRRVQPRGASQASGADRAASAPRRAPASPTSGTRAQAPAGSPPVSRRADARSGVVLAVEGNGEEARILLDIGTETGVRVGDIISVGGTGPDCGLWKIVSASAYYSRAEHVKGTFQSRPGAGDQAIPVRELD